MPRDLKLASWRLLLLAALSLGLAFAVVGCGSDIGGAAVTATASDAGATSPPPSTPLGRW
ncbi:MAG TPA: hypothetical protein VNN10_08455 [Dehalococcoidia bacterium]|nr:hypothetical protein [Dehalococcoidia bacterium]